MKLFLVVENEKFLRDLYGTLITSRYKHAGVDFASNGKEALEKVEVCDYSIILSDIDMPVMNGIDFYKILKKRRPSMTRRIAYISSARDEAILSYIKMEGLPYLRKPFDMMDFHNFIKRVLKKEDKVVVEGNSINDKRRFERIKLKTRCSLDPSDSSLNSFNFISAETTDYSEGGLGLKYEGKEISVGTNLSIFWKDITKLRERGKLIWSCCKDYQYCKAGVQWLRN